MIYLNNKTMKKIVSLLVAVLFAVTVHAQTTNYKAVMVETNGVLYKPTNFFTTNLVVTVNSNGATTSPTNFWTANSNSINSIVGNEDWVVQNFASIDWISVTDSERETNNSTISQLGSVIEMSIPGTNSSGVAALRMSRFPNWSPPSGSGIRWTVTNSFWVRLTTTLSTNGDIVRIMLGKSAVLSTNFIGAFTTNGVGTEIRNNNGTNQIRLIAHNGATNIESSWIDAATTLGRLNVGVVSAVGNVTLYQSRDSLPIALVTNISITNGPTTVVGSSSAAFYAGIIATNTNALSRSMYIFDALLRATE